MMKKQNTWITELETLRQFEYAKERIVFRLVNQENQKEKLTMLAHIPFMNLAVTFGISYKTEATGYGTLW